MTRYCVFEWTARPQLSVMGMDKDISLQSYAGLGKLEQERVAWFFGDQEVLPDLKLATLLMKNKKKMGPMFEGQSIEETYKFWLGECKNRQGIEVVSLSPGQRVLAG